MSVLSQHSVNILYLIILCVVFLSVIIMLVRVMLAERKDVAEERFRLEITGYQHSIAGSGLYIHDSVSPEEIHSILRAAIARLCRDNPEVVKLLLYHCIESLEGDEDILGSFVRFQKEVLRTISKD